MNTKETNNVEVDNLYLNQTNVEECTEDEEEKKQFNPYQSNNAQYPDVRYNVNPENEDYGGYDEGFENFNLKSEYL